VVCVCVCVCVCVRKNYWQQNPHCKTIFCNHTASHTSLLTPHTSHVPQYAHHTSHVTFVCTSPHASHTTLNHNPTLRTSHLTLHLKNTAPQEDCTSRILHLTPHFTHLTQNVHSFQARLHAQHSANLHVCMRACVCVCVCVCGIEVQEGMC